MDRASLPVVSVVVVNYRGAEDTITCVRGLAEVDYPAELLQVIVVDNEAHDTARLKSELSGLPGVKIVPDDRNLGFAGGCNLGVEFATGDVLAFLNNDARADRNWIKSAIRVFHAEPSVGAVASKVLDWDGKKIDFVDGGLTWFGMGYKRHVGEVDDGSHDAPRDVLFGTGSALFVRTALYRELGGFDERFFMFYEDVDLGWRLNLRGWRVRYEPASLTFHRHHASMSSIDHSRELYLLERNALATLYKNFSDETLARVLPAALALVVRRATARGDIDARQLEITRRPADPAEDRAPAEIPRESLAGFLAIDQFVEMMPKLAESRRIEQASRRMSDVDLVPLMRKALEPAYDIGRYIVAHDILVEALGVDEVFGKPRKILVITGDAISERMAGPAIRAWHMADVLSGEHEVRLITTNPLCDPPDAPFVIEGVKLKQLPENVRWADVIVLQGHALEMAAELKQPGSTKIVVCDIYDPMHLELLEQGKDDSDEKRAADLKSVTRVLTNQLERGDFFLCASERQRHFWLGHLAALGRLTPTLYDNDPTTQSLLGIVPFGLSGKPPQRTGPAIKGVVPGVTDADKVVIWAGGVYSWFDPLSLVKAMDHLRQRQPSAKLYFLGMKHPNPEVPDMDIAGQTRALSAALGLTGETVFFNDGWVPYTERQNWLLDANCGVTTHYEHVETTFAFRTRVLDYLWAGLPFVTTSGDSFADLVLREGLGVVVPPEDPVALADALEKVLYDEEFAAACRERIAVVRERFTWETALAPLAEFCRNPRPAADRLSGSSVLVRTPGLSTTDKVKRDLRLVREYLDAGGPTELAKRATGRLRKIARGGKHG